MIPQSLLQRLDTRLPPTFDRPNPEVPEGPYLDLSTLVRHTRGQDPFDYATDQRFQGDLAVRDLTLLANQRRLFKHFSGDTNRRFAVGAVAVPAATQVVIGQFAVADGYQWALSSYAVRASRIYGDVGASALDIGLSIQLLAFPVLDTGTIDYTVSYDAMTFDSAPGVYTVIVYNNHEFTVSLHGSVVVTVIPLV